MLIFMEFFSFTFDEIFMTFSQKGMRKKHLERKEEHEFFRLVCNLSPQLFCILLQTFKKKILFNACQLTEETVMKDVSEADEHRCKSG